MTKHPDSSHLTDSGVSGNAQTSAGEIRRAKEWLDNRPDTDPSWEAFAEMSGNDRKTFVAELLAIYAKQALAGNKETTMRVWCVGSDQTEYYAARDRAELRKMCVEMVGEEQTAEDFAAHCEEVPQGCLDDEFEWNDDGKLIKTTWRKQIENVTMPCQISTGYN